MPTSGFSAQGLGDQPFSGNCGVCNKMEHARYSNSQESTSSPGSSPFSEESGPENSGYGNAEEVSVDQMGGQYQSYPIGSIFPVNKLYNLIDGLTRLHGWSINPQELAMCLRSARNVLHETRYVINLHGPCIMMGFAPFFCIHVLNALMS